MRIALVIIMIMAVFSCKKKEQSTKEVLEGTETTAIEAPVTTNQESQNAFGDAFGDQISMEIDESVFVIDNGTNRANEDMSAGIMKMLAPQPYSVFKERIMQNLDQGEGITSLGIDEVEMAGKKMLVQKSKTIDDAGDEMIMVMHAFAAGENKTIMISSYYMKTEESKYLPLIENSVRSARLKK